MLAHFIQRKSKGGMVIVPLVISVILFIVVDALTIDDKYIDVITLLSSAMILYFIDNKKTVTMEGSIVKQTVVLPRVKGKNELLWIEVRY